MFGMAFVFVLGYVDEALVGVASVAFQRISKYNTALPVFGVVTLLLSISLLAWNHPSCGPVIRHHHRAIRPA